jgi:peptide/nickel transport system permease protein
MTTTTDNLATATPIQMMAVKFRKHRLAVAAGALLVGLYLVALFAEFIAPYDPEHRNVATMYAPPQRLHWVGADGVHVVPFVYALRAERDPVTLRMRYTEDRNVMVPLRLFAAGDPYRLWNLIPGDRHLFSAPGVHLLGTDRLGRDVFSRIVHGSRVSLTVGLAGVAISFLLGLLIGGISGYCGGWVDNLTQRLIEIVRAFPAIPLWLALSAALPATWPPLRTYFGITLVLSLIGWTGLARQVRGKLLALREEDFATAALLAGASRWRIITRHLLPGFMSHIIVSLTLAVPAMILGETALSFLGLGLKPPVTSWGVLLKDAQNVQAVALYPWILAPVAFVILAVLAFNFLGDGLRDAADPYTR